MKIAILGSGGREHALCHSLKKSKRIEKIYCIPGNAGTQSIAENLEIDINDHKKLEKIIIQKNIEIVVIGPEKPLVDGLTDILQKNKIKVFGPNKICAQLEGSKIFTKKLCEKYNIPTAKFSVISSKAEAENFINQCQYPLVIKADGLAAGKGVYICQNIDEALNASIEIFEGKFGKANQVLFEEFLVGEEMSFFIISDGKSYKVFGTAQDHKRVFEGDKGKNTGGMGAYSPSRLENNELNKKILEKIIDPTLKGMRDLNTNYCGFLYAGLMIVDNEPYLIEYNVRMGDPECQTILPKLKTDFFSIIDACLNQKLDNINIEWHNHKSLCIVLCSNGYPDKYKNNLEIELDRISPNEDEFIFHAGTKLKEDKILSNGGRVLNFVSISDNFNTARTKSLDLIEKLNWKNGFHRKDIGFKVIDK